MSVRIALLRGINVGGRNRIAMDALRHLCEGLGWHDVRTYIQSGNVVFRAGDDPGMLETSLEAAIEAELGLRIPVVVRSLPGWRRYVAGNPFAAEAEADPRRVVLCLSKRPPAEHAPARIQDKGADGERVAPVGDALCIHFPAGMGRSKLGPDLLDRAVGSPVTARNWRTVLTLEEIAMSLDES